MTPAHEYVISAYLADTSTLTLGKYTVKDNEHGDIAPGDDFGFYLVGRIEEKINHELIKGKRFFKTDIGYLINLDKVLAVFQTNSIKSVDEKEGDGGRS